MYKSCNSFIKFISKYIVLVWGYCKWKFFLISISECSLLVYKDTIHFCILMYPTTLLNSYISSNCVLVTALGFFYMQDYVLYRDIFYLLPSIRMPSFLSCLIALSRTSGTTFNSSGYSFFSWSSGKAFSLSLLSMMLAVSLVLKPKFSESLDFLFLGLL